MVRSVFKLFRIVILVSLVASGVHYLINNKSYTFKVAEIKRLGEKYAGKLLQKFGSFFLKMDAAEFIYGGPPIVAKGSFPNLVRYQYLLCYSLIFG